MNVTHTAEGNSGSAEQECSTNCFFVTEIQSMMHGFGDSRTPLLESASLVETIVQQQQWMLINQSADVATMRGSKLICPEDIMFLLRRDRVKVHRLLKYLAMKDLKNNITTMLGDTILDTDVPVEASSIPPKKRSRLCLDFLESIDQTGELTDTSTLPVDMVKYERNIRAERSSRLLDEKRYLEFVNARRVSFVSIKSAPKFREWLRMKSDGSSDSPKLSNMAYDLLGYLAYEMVAEIVDMALLVRQDSMASSGAPFSRYLPSTGYSMRSLDCRQIETAHPISPAEIREAIRRCWMSPIGPSSSFTRNMSPHVPLLGC